MIDVFLKNKAFKALEGIPDGKLYLFIEVGAENEQGENIQTKAAFEALLKIKSEPKTKEDVKMDINHIK